MDKAEIILYQPDEKSMQLEVRIDDETVWLSQSQMVELFDSTKQNISLHINNIFKERELYPVSTVKEYLTVQVEGFRKTRRKIKHYNLDVIISVGYRVKSYRGTQFRIWAKKTRDRGTGTEKLLLVPGSLFPGSIYLAPGIWYLGPFYSVTDFRVVKDPGPSNWHPAPKNGYWFPGPDSRIDATRNPATSTQQLFLNSRDLSPK